MQPAMMHLPALGTFDDSSGLVALPSTADGRFLVGHHGVTAIAATGDRKVEFVAIGDRTLAHVRSGLGYPAYYPVEPVWLQRPVRAVLMDLDGTSVRSERFWVRMIEQTTATLKGDLRFQLEAADLPHVSGHSVSEHLEHCVRKYVPAATVEQARGIYFDHVHREMRAIVDGYGQVDAFEPVEGLEAFLRALKARDIRTALVTSGLHEKAWPEIVAAFATMGLGDPASFYDAIITAGVAIRPGQPGTLGELAPKPHPWLYAEAMRVGLGIPFSERAHVMGMEDSGAGVCALRLAGVTTVGMTGGNIDQSGTRALCAQVCASFDDVVRMIDG
jgi:beta-phosphoglucomutase-like phosphatase (HAD superfamily)